ncbi:MAG: aspartyl protease family protein [Planctomycetes bacterium]|nr:aspartyl protease family protein [Planctomycetota bacterium]
MKIQFALLCITVFFIPAAAQAQGQDQKQPPKKFVVPFEIIKTQHMVVNVKVNGKGPFRVVFDTGAPDSLVSNKLAKAAGLKGKGGGLPLFGARGAATINSLEIGDLKATNVSTMIMDHPTVNAIASLVGPLEGIIGFTFYSRYKMSIDYEKKLMTFEPNTYVPGDVMQMMMKKMLAPKSVRQAPRILAPAGLFGIRVEKAKDDDEPGVTVKQVLADSPAGIAGFKAGDRLLTLDGRWTDTVADCYIAAGHVRVGQPAVAFVVRDGKKILLKVTARAGL